MDPREQQRSGLAGGATEDRSHFPWCFLYPLRRPAWRGAWRSDRVAAIHSVAAAAGLPSGTPASAVTCARSGAFGASTP